MNTLKRLVSLYGWRFPTGLVYMLQSGEYEVLPYLRWFWRVPNYNHVMHRRSLDRTLKAQLLLAAVRAGIALQLLVAVIGAYLFYRYPERWLLLAGAVAAFVSYPFVWAHLLAVPVGLGRLLIVNPREKKVQAATRRLLEQNNAIKIAVAGSYGKTSMKEILATVLGAGKRVAATPGNFNTPTKHFLFTKRLTGNEEVLIYELGEGKPGDVVQFNRTIQPDLVVITGLAPAHLDHYPTLEAAGEDIMHAADGVSPDRVFVNADSEHLRHFIDGTMQSYSTQGVGEWKVDHTSVAVEGVSFRLKHNKRQLHFKSPLLGTHQIGPLSAAAAIAHLLGMSDERIEAGIAATKAFEHRMEPKQVAGAWVIDDTYNGNIEGVGAGIRLLDTLPAKRRIYVSPGLVAQGKMTAAVHHRMGELLGASSVDQVVLMENSVTRYIVEGLKTAGFSGQLKLVDDPLRFYQQLDQFVAVGDVVLMQNDWTDNYH